MTANRVFSAIPAKILLPIDFSPSSVASLAMAADLARHFHAELCLLHVLPFFPTATLGDFVPEEKFVEDNRAIADQQLDRCKSELAARGIAATALVEVGNDVAGNIMEVIEREQIDMVVISTHGIAGWRPAVFGSIAGKVVKQVKCPLLLLPSNEEEAEAKRELEPLEEQSLPAAGLGAQVLA